MVETKCFHSPIFMIRLNPDKAIVDMVRTALKNNNNKCPCQLGATCPCDSFKAKESGYCNCELYEKL